MKEAIRFLDLLLTLLLCQGVFSLFKPFPQTILQHHIYNSNKLPICVVYKLSGVNDPLEKVIWNIWKHRKNETYGFLEFGLFQSEQRVVTGLNLPEHLPSLRCYTGSTQEYDYRGKAKKANVKEWLSILVRKYKEKFPELNLNSLRSATTKHRITVIGFGHENHHLNVEELLYRLHRNHEQEVGVYFIHAHESSTLELRQHLEVTAVPAVVCLVGNHTTVWQGREVNEHDLNVFIYAHRVGCPHLTMESFADKAVELHPLFKPLLIGIYTSRAPAVIEFLKALRVTSSVLASVDVRLSLIDANSQFNLVSRYVSVRQYAAVPFVVLLWPERATPTTPVTHISQHLLPGRRPSPHVVCEFLETFNVSINGYPPWRSDLSMCPIYEGPDGNMCSKNSLNSTDNTPRVWSTIRKLHTKKSSNRKRTVIDDVNLRRHYGIPVVSASTWSPVIERSHAANHPFLPGAAFRGEVTKVALVIFIIDGCKSCVRSMPVFQDLKKSIGFITGGSIYLVNCSTDLILCRELRVNGYPSLSAFRGLGWLQHRSCAAVGHSGHKYTRTDYHGVLSASDILLWFSSISTSAVTDMQFASIPKNFEKNGAQLTAELIPRNSRYLRKDKRNTALPYACFRFMCEVLYGQVPCFSQWTTSITKTEFDENDDDMVVIRMSLDRDDGASSAIMLLGRSLAQTMEKGGRLHAFHSVHRYNIPRTLKCEDDHASCVNTLIAFVLDHSRLPVTHMTAETFHTHGSFLNRENLPVLVALAHAENISSNAEFFKTLSAVARELYSDIMTVTVDVDVYSSWAGSFVPKGYSASIPDLSSVPGLYVYPRLCIVQWSDHSHAAFLPGPHHSVSRHKPFRFSRENMLTFVREYLISPDSLSTETEHF